VAAPATSLLCKRILTPGSCLLIPNPLMHLRPPHPLTQPNPRTHTTRHHHRGEVRCLGCTSLDKFRKFIEKDPGLERRFQQVGARAVLRLCVCAVFVCVVSVRVLLHSCVCGGWLVGCARVWQGVGKRGAAWRAEGGRSAFSLWCRWRAHQHAPNAPLSFQWLLVPSPSQIPVEPPSLSETISILRGLRHK